MSIPLKVLVIEDSEEDTLLILRALRGGGYQPKHERIDTEDGMKEALASGGWDVILSDYVMPRFSGAVALEMLKESGHDIPFVIVSGKIGEETAVDLMKGGAHDYICKDNLARLAPAVERGIREIAERRARRGAEAALRESEETLRLITLMAAEAIMMIDNDGSVVFWNPAAERIFGYRADEVMGRGLARLIVPGRFREAHGEGFAAFRETGRGPAVGKTLELAAVRRDGTEIPVELSLSAAPFRGKWHALGIIRDVSERRRAEEERRRLEGELIQAQKMETIGRLAGGVAHDFNNMLNAIIGFSSMLQYGLADDDPLQANVNQILAAADKGASLARSLMTLSRKQAMNPRPVDLNDIIVDMEKFLRMVINADMELCTMLAPVELPVFVDSGQIEQVLMNLTTNARDALPRGGTILIETSPAEIDDPFIRAHGYGEPGCYASVSVTDSGVGMDEETMGRIFEPFFTTKEVGKGTGLGLSIVYGIVKQHGGYVNVRSREGEGTSFTILLPLASREGTWEGRGGSGARRLALGGTETLLLAEDDVVIRELTTKILRDAGYRVITAENGCEAVDRFVRHRDEIRLLLFDLIMPKMNGKEAFDEIRRLCPEIKTLFVSGYTSSLLRRKGLLAEGLEIVAKPILPLDLLRKVREALDG